MSAASEVATRRSSRLRQQTSPAVKTQRASVAQSPAKKRKPTAQARPSKPATKKETAPPSNASIPLDVVRVIVSNLDPSNDRGTLRNIIVCSRDFWAIGTRQLYTHLELNGDQLYKLIRGSYTKQYRKKNISAAFFRRLRDAGTCRLSPTAQECLALVKSLDVQSFLPETFEELWDASLPDAPLFPAVRSLRVGGFTDDPNDYPEDNVVLCDNVDVCSIGGAYKLVYFPVRDIQTMVVHGGAWYPWTSDRMARLGANKTIYLPGREHSDWAAASGLEWKESDSVISEGAGKDARVHIGFNIPKAREAALWAHVKKCDRTYKHTKDSPLQIMFAEDVVLCAVCGEYSHCSKPDI